MMTNVETVLAEAQTANDVIAICFSNRGELSLYSTLTNGPEILWALELAKQQILEMGQPEDA